MLRKNKKIAILSLTTTLTLTQGLTLPLIITQTLMIILKTKKDKMSTHFSLSYSLYRRYVT